MTYDQTPKEKAIQLIEKFKKNTRAFNETNGWEDSSYDAKQCALICVDEIIDLAHFNTISYSNYADGEIVEYTERVYWQEVKKEIEQL